MTRHLETIHDHLAGHYEKLATELEREARSFRQKADQERARSDHTRQMNAWREVAMCVRQLTLQGDTFDAALQEAARQFQMPPETVEAYVDKERKEEKFAAQWWRDREIMRLAYTGMTNKEIGAHMGLTKDWISKRIQHRLREGWRISKTLGDFPMYHRKARNSVK